MSRHFITLLAVLAICGLSSAAGQPAAKNDPPKPLPKEIAAAWKEAGAEVGWMRADKFGLLQFLPEKKGAAGAGDLPAFKFSAWKDGMLLKLAPPASPFGLDLLGSHVRDPGLKDLAGLKNLQALAAGIFLPDFLSVLRALRVSKRVPGTPIPGASTMKIQHRLKDFHGA